jgi:hypothetical protein
MDEPTCPACQTVTHAAIPADLCRHSFGPNRAATLACLVGCHRLSRRGVAEIAQAVFDVPPTLCLPGRPVLTYLQEALCAPRKGVLAPKLLPAG